MVSTARSAFKGGTGFADVSRMRIRVFTSAFLIGLAACGGGGGPAVPAGQEGAGGPLEVLERAQDVAGQLDSREAEMEEMVDDLGG